MPTSSELATATGKALRAAVNINPQPPTNG
jgi:hypothetical protein